MSDEQSIELVERSQVSAKAAEFKAGGWRLVQISSVPTLGGQEITYSFDKAYRLQSVRTTVPNADPVLPTITGAYFAAFTYENELQDLVGLKVLGLPLDFKGNFYRKAMNAPLTSSNPDGKAG
ncbi:MAG: NADH-quinone oxidoreductase subunit C [Candidatus Coatesbacteria bacterium]